ncbi:hypothetical protein [Diaphorobacter nitroreducens]|uniref:hypothetical protein n=1 Tax=Diaphorobacter nitroreducens TaxID=164759 RepID=UPI00289F5BCD|nr:hypothetical protein [Diaphorobacter nitroreducens]
MPRIGEIKCCNPACGCTDVAVHRTAGGKLSARCHKCATERWAPVGTRAHRDMTAQTVMDEDEAPAPEPAPKTEPAPTAAPAKKPRSSAFDLAAL